MTTDPRPLLALTVGDPAGIGPEIALEALYDAEVRAAARLVVVGPLSLRPGGLAEFGTEVGDPAWLATEEPDRWEMGRVQAGCGRAALAALAAGAELASSARVEALVTGPVSKAALHAAGEAVEGQTELLARWAGVRRYEMLAVAGRLRVMLLSRHLPLRRALDEVRRERVEDHLRLLDGALRELGIAAPRLAVAGLNPHAGEGGLLGEEDGRELAPAVETLRAEGLDVEGPVSPDSVFLLAYGGRYDGVLALYHDQAFIPIKLLSEDRGVTTVAGLPYLRVSPVHGTAFDIAGRGLASSANLRHALLQAAEWALARREPPRARGAAEGRSGSGSAGPPVD